MLQVLFIDYGNVDIVSLVDVLPLTPSLSALPIQAWTCTLNSFSIPDNLPDIDALQRWLNGSITGSVVQLVACEQTNNELLVDIQVPTAVIQSNHSVWLLYDTRFYYTECLDISENNVDLVNFLLSLISKRSSDSPHHNSVPRGLIASSTPHPDSSAPQDYYSFTSSEGIPGALSCSSGKETIPHGATPQSSVSYQEFFPSASATGDVPRDTSIANSQSVQSNTSSTPCKANTSHLHVTSDSDVPNNPSSCVTMDGSVSRQSLASNIEEQTASKENDSNACNVAGHHRYSNISRSLKSTSQEKLLHDLAVENQSRVPSETGTERHESLDVSVKAHSDETAVADTNNVNAEFSADSEVDVSNCNSMFLTPPQAPKPEEKRPLPVEGIISVPTPGGDIAAIPVVASVFNRPQSASFMFGQEVHNESRASPEVISEDLLAAADTLVSETLVGVTADISPSDIPLPIEESGDTDIPSSTSLDFDQLDIDDCILPPPLSFDEDHNGVAKLDEMEQTVSDELVTTSLYPISTQSNMVLPVVKCSSSCDIQNVAHEHTPTSVSTSNMCIEELSPIYNEDAVDSSEEEKCVSFVYLNSDAGPSDLSVACTVEVKAEVINSKPLSDGHLIDSAAPGDDKDMKVSEAPIDDQGMMSSHDSAINDRLTGNSDTSPSCASLQEYLPTANVNGQSTSVSSAQHLGTGGSDSMPTPNDATPRPSNSELAPQPMLTYKDLSILDLKLEKQSEIALCLSHIVSPRTFYAFPIEQCNKDVLELESSLQDHYSKAENQVHLKGAIEKGWLCCAEIEEDSAVYMYRGVIVDDHYSTEGECSSCTVFAVDYGHTNVINMEKIFVLNEKFTSLPVQCICCSLDGVIPKPGTFESLEKSPQKSPTHGKSSPEQVADNCHDGKSADTSSGYISISSNVGCWEDEAQDAMKSLTLNKQLIGIVSSCQGNHNFYGISFKYDIVFILSDISCGYVNGHKYSMLLYDTNGENDVLINKELVNMGLALPTDAYKG